MSKQLVAPTFLFRYSIPCRFSKKGWTRTGISLGEEYKIQTFRELDGVPPFADFRMAWNTDGLYFNVAVAGKKQSLWGRPTRLDDSDGIHIWIDTRDTQSIHRATKFCHRFCFMPSTSETGKDAKPHATMLRINRAKEESRSLNQGKLEIRSSIKKDGYKSDIFIPAESIFGYDVSQYKRLGFCFAVVDRELGWQTFSSGPEFPIQEDPSMWGSVELVDA